MTTMPEDNPLDTMSLADLRYYANYYRERGPWLEQIEAEIARREAAADFKGDEPMFLSFELSMPSNNSWNGKWTGDDKPYFLIRTAPPDSTLPGKRFTYSFGDGWVAAVKVEEVDGDKANELSAKSKGFCGYDWMVDSILKHGKIIAAQVAETA